MKFTRALFLLSMVGITACSTAKPIGVRSEFQKVHVKKIGVMAVFSTGRFSLDAEAFAKLRSVYAASLSAQLESLDFSIVDRKMIETPFSDSEKRTLEDGLSLPKSLDILFEPDHGEYGTEVDVVQKFYSAKSLPAYILFAEIIYHSSTICHESAEQSNSYAQINDKKITLPSPCILAHFRAKLIDSKTGKPMWSNRSLVEHRLGDESEHTKELGTVIRKVIGNTMNGENGINHMR